MSAISAPQRYDVVGSFLCPAYPRPARAAFECGDPSASLAFARHQMRSEAFLGFEGQNGEAGVLG